MKRVIFALLMGIGAISASAEVASATGDDGWSCPQGTVHDYKVEPLSGKTFTVPTPPNGWTVEAVILKVGGPGGGSHITFTPVTPGQVLSVAYQQYDISHAHICKGREQETTTSTSTTTTTTTLPEEETTTTSTSSTSTTSTSTTTTLDPTTTSSIPETSTTAAPTTGPSTTVTTIAPTSSLSPTTTTTVLLIEPPLPPAAPTTTITPNLPVTGTDAAKAFTPWALLALSIGGIATLAARRKREEESL